MAAGFVAWEDGPLVGGIETAMSRLDFVAILRGALTELQRDHLDQLAPTHLRLASSRRAPLVYSDEHASCWFMEQGAGGAPPVVRSLAQEWFGQQTLPSLGGDQRLGLRLEVIEPSGVALGSTG